MSNKIYTRVILVSVHEAPAVGCTALTGQLIVSLLLLETVVIRELLTNADVLTGKKDQVGLPLNLQNLRVQAGGAAVILQEWALDQVSSQSCPLSLTHQEAILRNGLLVCTCSQALSIMVLKLTGTRRRWQQRAHCESPDRALHGGIHHHTIIDVEQVAVHVLATVNLFPEVCHAPPQRLPPILDDHAVLLHLYPCNETPAVNARLHTTNSDPSLWNLL